MNNATRVLVAIIGAVAVIGAAVIGAPHVLCRFDVSFCPPPPATSGIPQPFRSEDGIPNGAEMSILVEAGTMHVLTSGPLCVDGTCLPGGERRGSVAVLLPGEASYRITGLVPSQNWHGAYRAAENTWEVIANDRVQSMKRPGNCTGGSGCEVVDVIVVGPAGIVTQYSR